MHVLWTTALFYASLGVFCAAIWPRNTVPHAFHVECRCLSIDLC